MAKGESGLYWRHNPIELHLSSNCARAFMEAPARWGEERMDSMSYTQAENRGMNICSECLVKFITARMGAHTAREERRLALYERRLKREIAAASVRPELEAYVEAT